MTNYISKCGFCDEMQFTGWYSKSAPRDMYGRVDRDYCDGRPVAYCSEEHRDAADALRESSVAAAGALAALLAAPPAWLPVVDHWEIARDDAGWTVSGQLAGNPGEADAYKALQPIVERSGQELADDGRLIKAGFEVDGVPCMVWSLRPVLRWVVPEHCATCPTKLGAPDVTFVRLGAGDREAPVICVPCRDRMHAEWVVAQRAPLVAARTVAREFFASEAGDRRPNWRQLITGEKRVADVDGIGPVCTDDDHEALDGNVYSCCPEPIVEVDSPAFGAYLVELLNADNGVGDPV
ncbi:hypothetical protein [Streptomyces niveus]|uniref:hypothetical protein n=2 Tax=Streptomyces niveus TaxID=193462 RepID=UPI0003C5A157|nr:hypothetical protein [Streptomyces niveus]EST22817.1 hypothetical protein M877_29000 [Streptomyces niveus NCIMB 11891]